MNASSEDTKVQVYGSGCPSCKKLFELANRAVEELGVKAEMEYVTDIVKILELGVMQSPVLVINGKPVLTGSTNDIDRVKELILGGKGGSESGAANGGCKKCSCKGGCR